jgi:Rifampin ADP-ribosyl transferase
MSATSIAREREGATARMSETPPGASGEDGWTPVTVDNCAAVAGPFFHGTRFVFATGDELVAGRGSNYHRGRVMNHVYFTGLVDTAAWGAELGTALAGDPERGHVYEVEPTGPFEDDPNVTNKRFPGNITQSYRTRFPVRVIREVLDWDGHPPDVVQGMLDSLARLREQGLDVIED